MINKTYKKILTYSNLSSNIRQKVLKLGIVGIYISIIPIYYDAYKISRYLNSKESKNMEERHMSRKFNIKKRFVSVLVALLMVLTIVPTTTAHAATYIGDQGYAKAKLNVYKKVDGDVYGTIYKNEGFTILNYLSNNWIHVEYSTSSGAKRGYVKRTSSNVKVEQTSFVATVTKDSSLYYGNSTSKYQKSGTVYDGEVVTVLDTSLSGWAFIEYNTNKGRKRGYMSSYESKLDFDENVLAAGLPIEDADEDRTVSGYKDVYSGPSKQYPSIGSVSDETVWRFKISDGVYYIKYKVDGTTKLKSGYIFY